ncbi:helix-turn-helix domain-containing protein [Pseudalkalibacillus salsuginis]|uniref:helix-turn-helix domain-containing protein n=1 Tax=Pseudalkalibacillus salsuginis TaxID=2910972 RepID=UPI001F28325A|nr:helix-turn-helix domain-containing protein [Pseudalkalibacillus salsuginis]MCF6409007.1 helix-turn-helix domain-containing protein [Pseudalkalibacillus salsuginis]
MKDNKTKQKFIELRAAGISFDKIAKQLNVAKSTLIDWSKEFEYEVANLKTMEMEALQEQYFIAKKNRIETIGEQTKKLQEELSQRDFSNVPTEKLCEIFLKYMHTLKQEEVEPVFQREKGTDESLDDMLNMTTVERWKAN